MDLKVHKDLLEEPDGRVIQDLQDLVNLFYLVLILKGLM
jgi:hypothetical protein